jgi:hypothetical protein
MGDPRAQRTMLRPPRAAQRIAEDPARRPRARRGTLGELAFGGTKLVPPAEVVERLSSRFRGEVQQLADNLGFDVRTFTNREARYLAGIKTFEAFQILVQTSARIREVMRSLSRKIDVQRSWERER